MHKRSTCPSEELNRFRDRFFFFFSSVIRRLASFADTLEYGPCEWSKEFGLTESIEVFPRREDIFEYLKSNLVILNRNMYRNPKPRPQRNLILDFDVHHYKEVLKQNPKAVMESLGKDGSAKSSLRTIYFSASARMTLISSIPSLERRERLSDSTSLTAEKTLPLVEEETCTARMRYWTANSFEYCCIL